MPPRARRRALNPLLLRRVRAAPLTQKTIANAAGFPNYPLYYAALRQSAVAATALTVDRLMRVADLVEFPRGDVFLDDDPVPAKGSERRADATSDHETGAAR
jgi:hypothetical protein